MGRFTPFAAPPTTYTLRPMTTAEWPTRGEGGAPLMYGRDHESSAVSRMCVSDVYPSRMPYPP